MSSVILIYLFLLILNGESQKLSDNGGENQSEGSSPTTEVSSNKCTGSVSWSDNNCIIGPVAVKVDIAPKVFKQLCPGTQKRTLAPTSCNLYIVCHDELLTVNRCPSGNHFHPLEQKCVDSHLFECTHPVLEDPRVILKERDDVDDQKFKRDISSYSSGNGNEYRVGDNPKSAWCDIGEEGIFPHPQSCEHFIQCGSGDEFVQKCPVGTAFNSRLSICDWPKNVGCYERRAKRSLIVYPDQNRFSDSSSKAKETHMIGRRSPCEDDFISPHPQSCNKFQICSNGRIHTQECSRGTLFNPLTRVCERPENVDCGSRVRDFGTYDCQKGYKYRTTYPGNCYKFLECENERIHVKTCPGNTIFNSEKSICDFSFKTKCKPEISLEHDIDINYLQQGRSRIPRDLSKYVCDFNYIAPFDGSCNQFIECENKQLFKKSCGPGTAYNPILGQCDWPHNVRSHDPEYCARYLQCDGRKFIPKQCPQNSYYNALAGKCDEIKNVNCAGKRDDPRLNPDTPKYLQSK